MAVVGIDFGTSNSVIAVWDEGRRQSRVPVLAGISREMKYRIGEQEYTAHVIPSLISYDGQDVHIGEQVYARGLTEAPQTFRWMKAYISERQPHPRRVAGAAPCEMEVSKQTCAHCAAREEPGRLCNYVAGRDFLRQVITYAADYCDLAQDELVFTMPVEAYEHYGDWLSEVCQAMGVARYRVVDEPTACVLGYEATVKQGDVFAVLDFGGGTLDFSVVRIDLEESDSRKCTELGKAGAPLGGRNISQWLYEDFLRQCGAAPHTVGDLSTQLLMEVEAAKEELSSGEKVSISVLDPRTNRLFAADYTRADVERVLSERGLAVRLQEVMDVALTDAEDKGIRRRDITQVLLVGGSTLIPSVRASLQLLFGERVAHDRPFTSVAVGACRFAAAEDLVEWIQHDYAVRYYDPETDSHEFETLVPRGTHFPSDGPVARLPVAGVFDDQERLRLELYELGDERTSTTEVVTFDENGRARVHKSRGGNHHFHINRDNPTPLRADPPAKKDQHVFDLTFTIDGSKRLLMTAMDVRTRELQYRDYPVAKLK